jgi:hypothetical protein
VTPTARSLAYLRQRGYLAAVVEHWLPRLKIRRDLFGFGDLLAVHPRDRLIVLVQVTTADHIAHRLAKARARPELAAWLKAGGRFEVHGWAKRGGKWAVRIVNVAGEDLEPVDLTPRPRRGRGRQRGLFDGQVRPPRTGKPPAASEAPSAAAEQAD